MTDKDLQKLFEQKLDGMDFEFNPSNWEAFEQMADPAQPLSEQEFSQLFKDKAASASFAFSEDNWQAFEQMASEQEPLSEQEYKKLFRDKLSQLSFPFSPANWAAMEEELGPENGMSGPEFQALFQNKAAETTFAFNPENWSRMEAILDQTTARPLAYFWRSAAAILLLAGLSVAALWQSPSSTLPSENLVVEPVQSEVSQSNSDQPKELKQYSPAEPMAPEPEIANTTSTSPQDNTSPVAAIPPSTPVASNETSDQASNEPSQTRTAAFFLGGAKPLEPVLEKVQPKESDLAFVDLAANDFASQEKEPYIPMGYSRVYAIAGPALSSPMNGKMGNPGWQAGLEYEYSWNGVSSLSAGLVYNRSGDIGLETMQDSTFFGLGRTDVQTHRHYENLSSLRIPLNYRYNINKHGFGFGLNTDILISVTMHETKTTTVFKQDPKIEYRDYNQDMESFSPVNFSASLSYYYQYNERLSLALSYAFALNDISRDHAQNFEAQHLPGQANLQLRYRLFEE